MNYEQLLTEYLGECWLERIPCKVCTLCDSACEHDRTFTTAQDFHDLVARMVEVGDWEDFEVHAYKASPYESLSRYIAWLITNHDCSLVARWLEERKEK